MRLSVPPIIRQDIRDAVAFTLRRYGRDARHLFLYEIVAGQAHVYGLLYDGMDLLAQWQARKV